MTILKSGRNSGRLLDLRVFLVVCLLAAIGVVVSWSVATLFCYVLEYVLYVHGRNGVIV